MSLLFAWLKLDSIISSSIFYQSNLSNEFVFTVNNDIPSLLERLNSDQMKLLKQYKALKYQPTALHNQLSYYSHFQETVIL